MLRRNLKPWNCCNTNKRSLEINLRKSQEVNEKLIDDIKTFNDKMIEIVPRTIIQENKELKETLNVLHAFLDIYKQAEVDAEKDPKSGEHRNDNEVGNQTPLHCNDCPFISESKRGLSVHITRKHHPEQGQENLINF